MNAMKPRSAALITVLTTLTTFALTIGLQGTAQAVFNNTAEPWTGGVAYYGSRGTFFADVTGDRRADAVVINDTGITVRRSDGSRFLPNEGWTTYSASKAYYGTLTTSFADVTGDGRADAILVNGFGITVRRSDGFRFLPEEAWTATGYYGTRGTFFADVTGEGRADAIAVNDNGITVRESDGQRFQPPQIPSWTDGTAYYGTRGTFFADVDGYGGMADAIAVNDDGIWVRHSDGKRFVTQEPWTSEAYYGTRGTFFADVTGGTYPTADAIAVNDNGVFVRRALVLG